MKKTLIFTQKVPGAVPVTFSLIVNDKAYSEVKIYTPRDKSGRPSCARPWYVYFYFTHFRTGKRQKVIKKMGINRYDTVSERKAAARTVQAGLTVMLHRGWDPFRGIMPQDNTYLFDRPAVTVEAALYRALEDKQATWSKTTTVRDSYRVKEFIAFLQQHNIARLESSMLSRVHVVEFLRWVRNKGASPSNYNNYRTTISSVVGQMVENGHATTNFVRDIKKAQETPLRNHPFTADQIEDIRRYLQEHNPNLLNFIRVMAYSFLRNREVLRLRVGDIDMKNRLMSVQTKTDALEKVYIIDQLYRLLVTMKLQGRDPADYLFTPNGVPGPWPATLDSKVDFMGKAFGRVKKALGLGGEFTIYSFRHSFAVNVYENHIKSGMSDQEAMQKMLSITRHSSLDGLRNYLREKKKMLPGDFGHRITLDF